jgi:hypothetical protein
MKRALPFIFWLARQIGDEQRMTNLQLIVAGCTLIGMIVNMVVNG